MQTVVLQPLRFLNIFLHLKRVHCSSSQPSISIMFQETQASYLKLRFVLGRKVRTAPSRLSWASHGLFTLSICLSTYSDDAAESEIETSYQAGESDFNECAISPAGSINCSYLYGTCRSLFSLRKVSFFSFHIIKLLDCRWDLHLFLYAYLDRGFIFCSLHFLRSLSRAA